MLHNVFDGCKQTCDTLYQMYNSEFNFQLTGSRFFGNSNPSSDYDFFVEM